MKKDIDPFRRVQETCMHEADNPRFVTPLYLYGFSGVGKSQ